MKVINDILSMNNISVGSCVAIGNFDGVHYGHQVLLKDLVRKSKERNSLSIVFTFLNHPMEKKNNKSSFEFGYINNNEEKLVLFERLGIDVVIMQPFNEKISSHSPEDFVKLLCNKLNVKEIFVGFNFSFGKGGEGNVQKLKVLGDKYDIKINEYGPILIDGEVVSSTLIRKSILEGNFDKVISLLGHPLLVVGEVIEGKKIARRLGFPTANINVSNRLYPPFGIYGAVLQIGQKDAKLMYGIVNVGINPTLKPGELCLEVHILDFDKEIYGEKIYLQLLKFLREERKFETVSKLVEAITRDKKRWQKFKEEMNGNGDIFKIK